MFKSNSITLAVMATTIVACAGCETIYYSVTEADRPDKSQSASLVDPNAAPTAVPSCDGRPGCVSVLSYNLKHRDVPLQLEAVARSITSDCHQPDFILLQEVVFGRPRKVGHENVGAALAELIDYNAEGAAREDGTEGIAILSRHPFDHYEHKHLDARDGWLSGGFPRVSVMGEFVLPGVGRVRVVNVHLAHAPSSHDTRSEQLRETLDWMAARQRDVPADVIILGGDFNIEPSWEELAIMQDRTACGDLEFVDFNSRTHTSGSLGEAYRRVDYIFIAAPQKKTETIGEAVLWRNGIPTLDGSSRFFPSDHLPLIHVFLIKTN
jgi:endonuclease/exonuclease/phosphatase family metal-dependent hydrolase